MTVFEDRLAGETGSTVSLAGLETIDCRQFKVHLRRIYFNKTERSGLHKSSTYNFPFSTAV